MSSYLNSGYVNDDNFCNGDRQRTYDYHRNIAMSDQGNSDPSKGKSPFKIFKHRYITVAVLTFINLINYIDRFTVAGVLNDAKEFYQVENAKGGLIQTSFVVCYMLTAPVFGYLGDRYNRIYLMAFGVGFWSLMTLLGSFVPANLFSIFLLVRALVGTGEASYSTIAPTIIGDLFSKNMRSSMLAVFYFAIPVGSGLGFIIGSKATELTADWQWSQRITPGLGIISVVLTLLFVQDPPRGEADGVVETEETTVWDDIKYLFQTKSFVYSTFGFTCVTFSTGALGWFGTEYMKMAIERVGESSKDSAMIFGGVSCASGICGVIIGATASLYFRRFTGKADPLLCAFGILLSVPLVFVCLYVAESNIKVAWAAIFFGETFMSINWTIVADILLYVVVPTRRSLAEAVQIMTSHALGDAISPYIIGQVSDSIYNEGNGPDKFYSLQYSFYIAVVVLLLGSFFFFLAALYVENDKASCTLATHALSGSSSVPEQEVSMTNQGHLEKNDNLLPQVTVL